MNQQVASGPFADLGLHSSILSAIEKLGFATPTPIQQKAIPEALAGRDILACAQTGTGKTAAFSLPILHRLLSQPQKRQVSALVLTPTRELAVQVSDNIRQFSASISTCCLYGGSSIFEQRRALSRQPSVVIATPGRLLDFVRRRDIDLRQVETFVLDEADRMLDMGFMPDIKQLMKILPEKRQTLLFSATLPKSIMQLAMQILRDPVEIRIQVESTASEKIEQSLYNVEQNRKPDLLAHLLGEAAKTLVFTRTKRGADQVTSFLLKKGFRAEAIHSDKSQSARLKALRNFSKGTTSVLIASDIVARGIDVRDISHVVNFDIPESPETYVHRIGRTGRADAVGKAFSLVSKPERTLLRGIERALGRRLQVVAEHPFS